MQTHDLTSEISDLELELEKQQILLEKAHADKSQFAETEVIFKQVKMLSDKLLILKSAKPSN